MALAGRKFRAILIGVVAALVVAGGFATTASAQADRDCADFDSQQEAQRFFEAQGGPQKDPNRLDADNDGDACETFPYDDDDGNGNASSSQYDQYNDDDDDQQQQQPQQTVINVPNKPLPNTGGPALLIPAGGLFLGVGLVMWRTISRRG